MHPDITVSSEMSDDFNKCGVCGKTILTRGANLNVVWLCNMDCFSMILPFPPELCLGLKEAQLWIQYAARVVNA